MSGSNPGPAERWLSHALVGLAAAAVFRRVNSVVAFIGGVLLHAMLDAPVARLLVIEGL